MLEVLVGLCIIMLFQTVHVFLLFNATSIVTCLAMLAVWQCWIVRKFCADIHSHSIHSILMALVTFHLVPQAGQNFVRISSEISQQSHFGPKMLYRHSWLQDDVSE